MCGLEPPVPRPGLKLPKAVADWLVRYAGGRFAAADFRPHIPTDASLLLLCDAKSDGFQSGLVRQRTPARVHRPCCGCYTRR